MIIEIGDKMYICQKCQGECELIICAGGDYENPAMITDCCGVTEYTEMPDEEVIRYANRF